MQGPVHFGENGIRDSEVTKLQVLQYRTTYINGTPIHDEGGLSHRLTPIVVAYVREDDEGLKFLGEDRNHLWPGIQVTFTVVTIIY